MRRAIAWCFLVGGLLATVPLSYLAVFYGWAAGGPPQTPEQRQVLLVWYFACLASALAAPVVGILVFRGLRRSKAAEQARAADPFRPSSAKAEGRGRSARGSLVDLQDTSTCARPRSRLACRCLVVAALLLYGCSWFLPPLDPGSPPVSDRSDRLVNNAAYVFINTIMMLFSSPTGKVDWFTWKLMGLTGATNFAVLLVVSVWTFHRFLVSQGVLLLAFGLLDLMWMYWLPSNGNAGLGIGYYLWLVSIWLLGLACLGRAWVISPPRPERRRPSTA